MRCLIGEADVWSKFGIAEATRSPGHRVKFFSVSAGRLVSAGSLVLAERLMSATGVGSCVVVNTDFK